MAAPAEDEAADAQEGDEIPIVAAKSSSKKWVLIGIVLVLVAGGAVGFALLGPKSEEPAPKTATKATAKKVEPPKVDLDRERADKLLAEAKQYAAENPNEFLKIHNRYENLGNAFGNLPAGEEAKKLMTALIEPWKKRADEEFAAFTEKVLALQKQKEYRAAFEESNKGMPIFDSFMRTYEWDHTNDLNNLRRNARDQIAAKERLDELQAKAYKYAREQQIDIALAILDLFERTYEGLSVWEEYQEIRKKLKVDALKALAELDRDFAEKQAAIRKAEAERIARERAAAWEKSKEGMGWTRQIPDSNLVNWVARSGNWTVDKAVMTGKNTDGTTTFAGLFGTRWLDYVVKFELKIDEGSVDFIPRTYVSDGLPRDESEAIEFTLEDFAKGKKGQWMWVSVEVQGEEVRVFKGEDPKTAPLWRTFKKDAETEPGETYRLIDEGGFLFKLLEQGSSIQLRSVFTKVIHQKGKQGFS